MKALVLAASALLFVACASRGPNIPSVNIFKLSHQEQSQVRSVIVYSDFELNDMEFEVLDDVEGAVCKRNTASSMAVPALEQLKYQAWVREANGLANVQIGDRKGEGNCVAIVVASATAIKVTRSTGTASH